MSRSLYETNALSGYAIATIAQEIEMQKINGRGIVAVDGYPGIYLITEEAEAVPPFNCPIEVKEEYYIDARSFTSVGRDGQMKVSNEVHRQFQIDLAVLERHWVHSLDKDEFFYLSPYALSHFCNWIGNNLTHNWRLDYVAEMKFRGAAALYYAGQHFNNVNDELTKTQLIRYLVKNVKTSQSDIEFILEGQEIDFPRTVQEFCTFLSNSEITLQLRNFESISLSNILSKTFTFGVNNPGLMMRVAYEHPPAFLALVGTILQNTYLRKSILGEQLYRDSGRSSFITTYNRFIDRIKEI